MNFSNLEKPLQNLTFFKKNISFKQLVNATGGPTRVIGGHTADIYYLPYNKIPTFIKLAKLFSKQFTFSEVAISTINACIEDRLASPALHGINVWDESREYPWLNFGNFTRDRQLEFYHPVKWSHILKDSEEHRQFLCNTVLPFLPG